jgi:hypothetical protein
LEIRSACVGNVSDGEGQLAIFAGMTGAGRDRFRYHDHVLLLFLVEDALMASPEIALWFLRKHIVVLFFS